MSSPDSYIVPFQNQCVMIDDTQNTSSLKWVAITRDSVGIGGGDTPLEAAISLANSLRRTADDIESAAKVQFANKTE